LQVTPDPRLSAAQQAVIALDYGMTDGALTIGCRAAMANYIVQLLRLDGPQHRDPEAQQVVLTNRDEVKGWLWGAG